MAYRPKRRGAARSTRSSRGGYYGRGYRSASRSRGRNTRSRTRRAAPQTVKIVVEQAAPSINAPPQGFPSLQLVRDKKNSRF